MAAAETSDKLVKGSKVTLNPRHKHSMAKKDDSRIYSKWDENPHWSSFNKIYFVLVYLEIIVFMYIKINICTDNDTSLNILNLKVLMFFWGAWVSLLAVFWGLCISGNQTKGSCMQNMYISLLSDLTAVWSTYFFW